ncbi:MAG TPA: S-layer homology domain-containing protein [Candidatus Eisenbacteria bacterium]|nr:S-layer homology domain-containing protein [Candidatus Eisenbacteria bacterium]
MKKTIRFLLVGLLVLTIFLGMSPVSLLAQPVSQSNISFSDVSSNHNFYQAIMDLSQAGVIQGKEDGSFGIDDPLTRAQAVVMLVRAREDLDPQSMQSKFLDVAIGSFGQEEIALACQEGIIDGYGNGCFGPQDYLTRGQLAKIVANAFAISADPNNKVYFTDTASSGFDSWIDALASNGIVQGVGDYKFKPGQYASRGHFAVYLANSLKFLDGSLEIPPRIEAPENKITNEHDLLKEILRQADKRISPIIVNYYGDDLQADSIDDIQKLGQKINSNKNTYSAHCIASISLYPASRQADGSLEIRIDCLYRDNQQEEFVNSQAAKIVGQIIKPGMSEFTKVKALHDYLINNMTYSFNTQTSNQKAYTLFNEKKGVCKAFALAFARLLDEVNIDNYIIIGTGYEAKGPARHAWNKVKINNAWYNVDVTWDLPPRILNNIELNKNNLFCYQYFLKSDALFNRDHVPDNPALFPSATNRQYEAYPYLDQIQASNKKQLTENLTAALDKRSGWFNLVYLGEDIKTEADVKAIVIAAVKASKKINSLNWYQLYLNQTNRQAGEPALIVLYIE